MKRLQSQLGQEVEEDGGAAGEGEEEAVDCAPEVGGVADVIDVLLGHVPAIEQV